MHWPLVSADWLPAFRRMSDFSNGRREQVNGRPATVVEFRPRRSVSPKSDLERQVGVMAGTLWIDEASQHVIRMESHLLDDFNRTAQGSSLRVERTLLNGEVWLPSQIEMNARLGFAFGNFSYMLGTTRYGEYKKFAVETDSAIALPAQ
jgi:hypothetical protein